MFTSGSFCIDGFDLWYRVGFVLCKFRLVRSMMSSPVSSLHVYLGLFRKYRLDLRWKVEFVVYERYGSMVSSRNSSVYVETDSGYGVKSGSFCAG